MWLELQTGRAWNDPLYPFTPPHLPRALLFLPPMPRQPQSEMVRAQLALDHSTDLSEWQKVRKSCSDNRAAILFGSYGYMRAGPPGVGCGDNAWKLM